MGETMMHGPRDAITASPTSKGGGPPVGGWHAVL